MIDELLWVFGWFVLIAMVRGLLQGARQAVQEHRRGETGTRGG